jgi:hypothetical protein
MIIVCDFVCWGSEHVCFNAGMLEVVLFACPDEPLTFFGESSHIKLLQEQMGPVTISKLSWKEVQIPDREAPYFQRVRLEKKLFSQVFSNLAAATDLALVLTVTPATLLALNLSRGQLHRGIPVQAVMHGILSGLGTKRSLRPLRRAKDINTAMSVWGRRNVQYLVLEKNIRDLTRRYLPCLADRIELLELPLSPNEGATEIVALQYPIRFGFLGMANREKGFPQFVQLAAETVLKHPGLGEFHAVGMYPRAPTPEPGLAALTRAPALGHLSRNDYVSALNQLHYTIFPYNPAHYALCASGTLLDAIAWEKPIIASRLPLFENLFERYGNIGFLFDSQCDLTRIVQMLITGGVDADVYHRQVLNLRKLRAARAPKVLAESYRTIRHDALRLGYDAQQQNAPTTSQLKEQLTTKRVKTT